MTSPLAGIPQPGRHEPGRRKCAGCPKMAAVRRMVRAPDGQLYGSSCARKRGLIGAPAGRGRGGHPIKTTGATTAPATLFDQPKEQPAMLPSHTTEERFDPTIPTGRRFVIERLADPTGVSSTGVIIDGIRWPDGRVAERWRGDDRSDVQWDDMGAVERRHCYGGHSRIVWIDPEPGDLGDTYFQFEHHGPGRATFTFNTHRMNRERRQDLLDDVIAWVTEFGLDTKRMPSNAPITFDTRAGTVTTRYAVPADPERPLGMVKLDEAGRVVDEPHTVNYAGTMPSMPDFLDRTTGEAPTA